MTLYRYFLLSSVLQFPYSFNVQQYRFFFALPSPRLCPPTYKILPPSMVSGASGMNKLAVKYSNAKVARCIKPKLSSTHTTLVEATSLTAAGSATFCQTGRLNSDARHFINSEARSTVSEHIRGKYAEKPTKTSCARGDTICPRPSPPRRAPPSRRNVAVLPHAEYVPTLTAAASLRVKAALSKATW